MCEGGSGDEELLTVRLRLVRPSAADVPTILALHRDPLACAHNPSDMLADPDEAAERQRGWDGHWRRHGFGYWSVRWGDADPGDAPIGFCGLKVMRLHGGEVLNLFYRLDPAVWGGGVASEAAAAVVGWAAARAPGRPVVARVRAANVASARVARRVGLRRAPQLDAEGEDGLDEVYCSPWPA
ncbi:GNAT family N-acetyltransferase [Micromonospora inositola]|uniref:Protein N-acetyltransferase, RimJ/RimL family n=1 Tax=Micromonospora inositola TaxID=47865 RepID=A0A1C5JPW6_9ACTN|nr:GNAT family protein [Micromonospora inositola]SCG72558.1 Protein N-acetyltransferase, RimJ/RimL family [Micromonospora inositola]